MLKEKKRKKKERKKREKTGGVFSRNGLCVLAPFLSVFLGEKLGGELG